MDTQIRTYVAELIGTFLFVLFGAAAVCAAALTGDPPLLGVGGIALAEGGALAVALTFTAPVSQGYLNPAVAIALWVFKRLDGMQTACLVAAQVVGAILAGLVLRLLFDSEVLRRAVLGTPHLEKSLQGESGNVDIGGLLTGMGIELALGFLVTLAVFATLVDRRGPRLGGVMVGLAQMAAVVVGYRLTGGAANPARWVGPALWQGSVVQLSAMPPVYAALVYAGGPVLGALLAAAAYTSLLLPPEKGKDVR
jgi:aquaporin Z